jgi:hypothetical protein
VLTSLQWHPTRPVIASVGTSGEVHIWQTSSPDNWSAFAPGFEELEENVDYDEREDEFDIVSGNPLFTLSFRKTKPTFNDGWMRRKTSSSTCSRPTSRSRVPRNPPLPTKSPTTTHGKGSTRVSICLWTGGKTKRMTCNIVYGIHWSWPRRLLSSVVSETTGVTLTCFVRGLQRLLLACVGRRRRLGPRIFLDRCWPLGDHRRLSRLRRPRGHTRRFTLLGRRRLHLDKLLLTLLADRQERLVSATPADIRSPLPSSPTPLPSWRAFPWTNPVPRAPCRPSLAPRSPLPV